MTAADIYHSYLTGFALLVLVSGGFYVLFMATCVFGQLRAAKKLHALLMNSILGTTLRWLDTTPTSRVITRCTKDIASVDGRFSGTFDWLGACIFVYPIGASC